MPDLNRERVKSLIGQSGSCQPVLGEVYPRDADNSLADGRCLPELAKFLSTQDQAGSIDGTNPVKTHTIGFDLAKNPKAEAFLHSVAKAGNGKFYSSGDSDALTEAFLDIISDTREATPGSFAAPTYTVDPSSMLANSKDIFLPLFESSGSPAWNGNLKKFKLDSSGTIVDVNNSPVMDLQGAIKATAVDFWMRPGLTLTDQSNPITDGGLASNLHPSSRHLLTDNGYSLMSLNTSNVSKSQLGNSSLSDKEHENLVKYIQGYESDGATPRYAMGDILHSKPTVIRYSSDKEVVFFGTNEGYLHAVDAGDYSTDTGTGIGTSTSTGGREVVAERFLPICPARC